ncbi:serine/threonine protein kinase [Antribacter sp. KLBMP9083]|uniref:non-specific serine/threonine protein kinase n=1 Tax=Antribacter soli TaxID=2910976 RepID=A0AA41QAI3_9MICO|nr:serine/threonine-protein kinase [Antribacter soli]MCF4119875.1 serine/threonine protein kinase [Antribacter soli]
MPVIPWTDDDVIRAFPEFAIEVPALGAGQQKVAYKASDVALKVLLQDPDSVDDEAATTIERFQREMSAMQATTCPHVATLVSGPELRTIGETERYWYTEPLLAGGTLKQRLRLGPLSHTEAADLARSLLLAVDAMWAQGIVHRDIKPDNIGYLSDGTVVLADLGIALLTEMYPVTNSQLVGPGTQYYAAPEQYQMRRNTTIDFRTDLFQVGIVVAESVMGYHPFRQPGTGHIEQLTSFDATVLDSFNLPAGLRELIPRLLAPHQSGRYRSVQRALKALGSGS